MVVCMCDVKAAYAYRNIENVQAYAVHYKRTCIHDAAAIHTKIQVGSYYLLCTMMVYNIFIMRVLDRSGCTRILWWCVHPDLRRRFLEQSECLRFTILPRHVSRCLAILQRTIAKSPATQTHTHRQRW